MQTMISTSEGSSGWNKRFLNQKETMVQYSDDYNSFELDESNNRGVKENHVTWLANQIKKDGQIEPIIVKINPKTGKKVIHGGQHRFKACQRLGIPVRFIIQNAMNNNDMVKVHVNHLAFGWRNYLELYMNKGIDSYIRYNQLLTDLTYNVNGKDCVMGHDTLLGLLHWSEGGGNAFTWDSNVKDPTKNNKLAFQQGLLEFTKEQEDFARRFVKQLDRIAPFVSHKYRHAVVRDKLLVVAIQKVWTHPKWRETATKPSSSWKGFDTLIQKLKYSGILIERGHAYDDYLDQFETILSFGNKRKNRVLFNI